jgi:hypothetical protein
MVGGATPINAPMITFAEAYIGIAGHLARSAVVAAVYPFVWRRDRSVVLNGLGGAGRRNNAGDAQEVAEMALEPYRDR